MKLILTQDVPKIGRKYEVKNVKDGFGRNFLMMRNLAVVWTPEAEKKLSEKIKMAHEVKKSKEEVLAKNLSSLKGFKITFHRSANQEGHLFAGVKNTDIIKFLEKEKRIIIPESVLEMEGPIKTLGEHKIKIQEYFLIVEVLREEK